MSFSDFKSAASLVNCSVENVNAENINLTTEAFRYLRNVCGTDPNIQSQILQESNILINTKTLLLNILTCEKPNENQILCLQVGLQFLGNMTVKNKNNQKYIWSSCQCILETSLTFENARIQNITAMIIYNIFLGNTDLINELKHPFEDLYNLTTRENTSEFAVFTLELLVLSGDYLRRFYDKLKSDNKLILLEVIKNLIPDQNQKLPPETIKFFSKQFIQKSDLILKTQESYANSLDPVEVVKILDLLVALSSDDQQSYLCTVQNETSLLINCIELLKNIHLLSKQSGNDFSMISKISEISEVEKSTSIQEHPIFGFKCSLIRLIGNFCWKNKANQNQVRELECIPVLLDCCNIDARNPFIIQWCILAIHNALEKNIENQMVIALLSKEGKIDFARLQELGINLNVDGKGDSLCIAPLE